MKRLALFCSLLVACVGEPSPSGLDQPLRASPAVFKEGALPSGSSGPEVTFLETLNVVLFPGQTGKALVGRTTTDASAVGLRFRTLGTGYWLTVVDAPDPSAGGELGWKVDLEIARDIAPGRYAMDFAAFDARGRAGKTRSLEVCVASPIPDNLNACDPKIAPPTAVVTLEWDTNVDLDLQLVTPEGKIVDGKRPTTAFSESGTISKEALADPRIGRIDRDSNGSCVNDGLRRESIVWQGAPHPGTYLVYANLFDACGQGSVRFEASLWLAEPRGDGTSRLVKKLAQKGQLLAADANSGSKTGLYLTPLTFE